MSPRQSPIKNTRRRSITTILSSELLDQVLEDERAAALDEFRQREELTIAPAELTDQ